MWGERSINTHLMECGVSADWPWIGEVHGPECVLCKPLKGDGLALL